MALVLPGNSQRVVCTANRKRVRTRITRKKARAKAASSPTPLPTHIMQLSAVVATTVCLSAGLCPVTQVLLCTSTGSCLVMQLLYVSPVSHGWMVNVQSVASLELLLIE